MEGGGTTSLNWDTHNNKKDASFFLSFFYYCCESETHPRVS